MVSAPITPPKETYLMKGKIYIYQAEDEISVSMYVSRVLGGRPVGVFVLFLISIDLLKV